MIKIKKLSDEDFKIAKQLSDFIERLDKIIFPDKSIEVFILTQPPPNESERFRYSPPNESERFRYCTKAPSFITNYEGELYLIFGGGLAERIEKEKQKSIMLFKDSELLKVTDQLSRLSLEEVLIGLASHEARHWLQRYFPERIFSPQEWQNTNNEYEHLKRVFRYVELLCREIYTSSEEFKREFDASLIEHIVVEKWHYGRRNFFEIGEIIKSGPSEFLELFNKFK